MSKESLQFWGKLIEIIMVYSLVLPWLMGIALAVDKWSVVVACIFPPYAWVLVTKYLLGIV